MGLYKLIRFREPLSMLVMHCGQQFWQGFRQAKSLRPVANFYVQLHHLGLITQLLKNLSSQGKSLQGF